jgi:hypothetical protein
LSSFIFRIMPAAPISFIWTLGLLVMLGMPVCAGAETTMQATVAAIEEYSDNILLERIHPHDDFVTTVTPSATVAYRAPIWTWDGYYSWEYRSFRSNRIYDGTKQTAHIQNQTVIIPSFLAVSAFEDYRKVSVDVATDYTQQGLIVNQIYQNTAMVNPFLTLKLTEKTNLTAGYMLLDLHYSSAPGVNRTDNINYIEAGAALSSRMTMSIGVRNTKERNSPAEHYQTLQTIEDYTELETYTSLYYLYGALSSISGRIAQSVIKYDETKKEAHHVLWNGNINHQFGATTLMLSSSMQYIQDPRQASTRAEFYSGTLLNRGSRSDLTLTGVATDYFNATINERTELSREARGEFAYRMTPRTTGKAFSSYQQLENRVLGGRTYSNLSTLKLEHRLTETFSISGEYRYFNSYSPQLEANNYRVNRGIVELRATF